MNNDSGSGVVIGGLAGLGLAWYWLKRTRMPVKRNVQSAINLLAQYREMVKGKRLDPRAIDVIVNMIDAGATLDSIRVYARTMIMAHDCRWRGELE